MTKEELDAFMVSLPKSIKIVVQDSLRCYEIESVGLKPDELILIIGEGKIADIEDGILYAIPRDFCGEDDLSDITMGPLDWIAGGMTPLPEPLPEPKSRKVKSLPAMEPKAVKHIVKMISSKNQPSRMLGLIRGKGGDNDARTKSLS